MSLPSDLAQDDEPIFHLAAEVEEMFLMKLGRFKELHPEANTLPLIEELKGRFMAWTAYLGVFAKQSVCLDRRLESHSDLQDLVLMLLDIMKTNMLQRKYHITGSKNPSHRARRLIPLLVPEKFAEVCSPSLQNPVAVDLPEADLYTTPTVSEKDCLAAIDQAVDRLNRLGMAIRQSSTQKVVPRSLADLSGCESFQKLAEALVRTLYPDATNELHSQLSKSMTCRYDLVISRQKRQNHLQQRRPKPSPTPTQIMEDMQMDEDPKDPRHFPDSFDHLYHQMAEDMDKGSADPKKKRADDLQSEVPSPLDRGLFNKTMGSSPSQKGSQKKEETSSIQINQIGYPKAPQVIGASNYATCNWCFQTRHKREFEGREWRY